MRIRSIESERKGIVIFSTQMASELQNRVARTRRKAYKDVEFMGFFAACDRKRLIEACAASEDERLQAWAAARQLPQNNNMLDVSLAQRFQVRLKAISEAYLDYSRAQGYVELAGRLPQAMADIAEDSLNRTMTCPQCFGERMVKVGCLRCKHPEDHHITDEGCLFEGCKCKLFQQAPKEMIECPACWGEGIVVKSGDPEARKAMLEAAKVTGQKGPLLAQQFNFDGGFSVEGLIKQGEKMLGNS